MKLIVCKGYRILCCKNNFVDCLERVRCYWSYGLGLGLGLGLVSFGLGLGLGLEPCGLVNITAGTPLGTILLQQKRGWFVFIFSCCSLYDTIWNVILTWDPKLTWVSLIYRTEQPAEKAMENRKKTKKNKKADMLRNIGKQSGEFVESVLKKKYKC